MASVGFIGESSCKKKHKLSRKLVECVAFDYSSVPKKLRSAIKTRRRESLTQPLTILTGKRRVTDGVAATKDRGKKCKLNTTKGRITKEEKEVAATLNALADMFSDVSKTSNEPSETKYSNMEAGNTATAAKDTGKLTKRQEPRRISKKGAIEAASYSSNFADSTSKSVKVDTLGNAQQLHLAIDRQSDTPVIQLDSRQKTPSLDVISSGEQAIAPLQIAAPCVQYGKHNFHPKEDRSFGSYQPASLCPSPDPGSMTQGSCRRLPPWLENAICTPKPQVTGSNVDKNPHDAVEPKASWKRCTAHVYIARLVQVLQMSSGNEGLLEKSDLTMSRGADGGNDVLFSNSNSIINSGVEKNSAEIQNAILLHKRLLQEQQIPLSFNTSIVCSSAKQGSDCQLDNSAGNNGSLNNHESVKRLHTSSHTQSQNLFLQSRYSSSNFHGCPSAAAAQQVQLPPFHFKSRESNVIEPFQQHSGSHNKKWPFQVQDRYNYGRGPSAVPYVAAWQDGGRHSSLQLNQGQSLLPHMHSALGPNYLPVSPPQHFTPPQLHNSMWFSATPTHL